MNFTEAFKELVNGKKIRRDNWNDKCYIEIDGDVIIDEDGDAFIPDFIDGEWQLYKEPKDDTITVEIKNDVAKQLFDALKGLYDKE